MPEPTDTPKARPPFYEVIAAKFPMVLVGISGDFKDRKTAEVTTLLTILLESDMPDEDARRIANDLKNIPRLFTEAHAQAYVIEFIDAVLADLRSR